MARPGQEVVAGEAVHPPSEREWQGLQERDSAPQLPNERYSPLLVVLHDDSGVELLLLKSVYPLWVLPPDLLV